MIPDVLLDQFVAATRRAEAAEGAFRREAAARLRVLETERAFAFRRLNWMKAVAELLAGAEDEGAAAAYARAALRARLDWDDDDQAHAEVLERFAAVARAMFATLAPPQAADAVEQAGEADAGDAAGDVGAALAAFEDWYQQMHGRSFWVLFEHRMPETPLVDF